MTHIKSLLAVIAVLTTCTLPTTATETEDKAAIKTAIFNYLEGFFEADINRLKSAFAIEGQMLALQQDKDGTDHFKVWKMEEAFQSWAERKPIPIKPKGEILSLDIRGGKMANVVFDSNGRFYDFLTLAKVNGDWKIISKAFIPQ